MKSIYKRNFKNKVIMFNPRLAVLLFFCTMFLCKNIFAQNTSLDFYLNTALQNSPLLKDNNNQLLTAAQDSALILAGFKPQVGLASQAMYAPTAKNFGYDAAISNGGIYSGLITVSQQFNIKKLQAAQLNAIDLIKQSLATGKKITETDLKKNITAQYLTAYTDYNQVQFTRGIVTMLAEEQLRVKDLVDKGIYQQTDYYNLSVDIKTQQILIEQTFIQYKNDLATLNYICGIADTSTVVLSNPNLNMRAPADVSNLPIMMQFVIDSLKNINDKYLIDRNYAPKLNAFADAGFNSILPQNIYKNFGTSIGLNFSIPIYDGRQKKMQYQKIAIAENSRSAYKDFYTTQYNQQFLQLNEQLKLTNNLITDIESQLSEQEKLIGLYKLEIEKGLVRFLDFITVVNNYISAKNNLLAAQMSRLQIINQMNYLK